MNHKNTELPLNTGLTNGKAVFQKISDREQKAVALAAERRAFTPDNDNYLNCSTCGPMTSRGTGLVRQRIHYQRYDGLALFMVTTRTLCPDCNGYGIQTLPESVATDLASQYGSRGVA